MRNCTDKDIYKAFQKTILLNRQNFKERVENKYLDSLLKNKI